MNRIDRIEHTPLTLVEIATELRAMLSELGRYEIGTAYSAVMRVVDGDKAAVGHLIRNIWREYRPGTDPPPNVANSI